MSIKYLSPLILNQSSAQFLWAAAKSPLQEHPKSIDWSPLLPKPSWQIRHSLSDSPKFTSAVPSPLSVSINLEPNWRPSPPLQDPILVGWSWEQAEEVAGCPSSSPQTTLMSHSPLMWLAPAPCSKSGRGVWAVAIEGTGKLGQSKLKLSGSSGRYFSLGEDLDGRRWLID